MALINFTGFETGDSSEGSVSANTSFSTTVVNTGNYSFRANPGAASAGYFLLKGLAANGASTNITNTSLYYSFWFQYAVKPVSNYETIMVAASTASGVPFLALSSSGTIDLRGTFGFLSTGTTVLSPNTWYRISGSFGFGSTWPNSPYTLKINGITEYTGIGQYGSNSSPTQVYFGKSISKNNQAVDFYYDDIILDDASEPNALVQISHPNANGTTMQWTAGTPPSDYTVIDEVVPNTADYVMNPLVVSELALFSIQSMATVGISGSNFLAVKAMTIKSENISVTSSDLLRITEGSTTSDTNPVNLTTTPTLFSKILSNDLATAGSWTESGINSLQLGAFEANAVAVRMQWAAVGILYESGSPATLLTASDSITTTENIALNLPAAITTSDIITTGENIIVALVPAATKVVTVADTITTTENISVSLQAATARTVNVSDSITLTENVSLSASVTNLQVQVSDSISLSENVSIYIQTFFASVSDTITTSETAFLTSGAFPIAVSDSITTTESVNMGVPFTDTRLISKSDTITTTENVALALVVKVSVSDSINTSETVNMVLVLAATKVVTVSDSITVSENVNLVIPTLFINVSDSITVSEFVFMLGPATLPNAPIPPRRTQLFSGGERRINQTRIEILDSNLNLITWVKAPLPLNKQGTILRYSKELSDYGMCTFRISSYDTAFTQLGDIVTPHKYHIRIVRDNVTVWQGAIIENSKRNKDFIEVVAAEYVWYLGKKLIQRSSVNPTTGLADDVYRIFSSGTMADTVTTIMNETLNAFATSNHALASLKLGTIENPNYPPNMTNANGTILTGPWVFGDGVSAPRLTYDFHSMLYVLKSFGAYTYADFNIDSGLNFNFKKFLGNDHHYSLTFTWGQHGNVKDFNVIRLGERMVNHLWGIAVDTNGKILHHDKTDEPSIQTNGILEQVSAYADIKDQGSLNARIEAELPLISTPNAAAITLALDQKSYPLGLYDIGDIVTVDVNHTAIQYNQIRRIVGITVDLKSQGRENVTIQLNVPRPFQYGSA